MAVEVPLIHSLVRAPLVPVEKVSPSFPQAEVLGKEAAQAITFSGARMDLVDDWGYSLPRQRVTRAEIYEPDSNIPPVTHLSSIGNK